MNPAIVSDWLGDSVTVGAMRHVQKRIDVAMGELRGAAMASMDPKVQAAHSVLRELELLQETLKTGRFE